MYNLVVQVFTLSFLVQVGISDMELNSDDHRSPEVSWLNRVEEMLKQQNHRIDVIERIVANQQMTIEHQARKIVDQQAEIRILSNRVTQKRKHSQEIQKVNTQTESVMADLSSPTRQDEQRILPNQKVSHNFKNAGSIEITTIADVNAQSWGNSISAHNVIPRIFNSTNVSVQQSNTHYQGNSRSLSNEKNRIRAIRSKFDSDRGRRLLMGLPTSETTLPVTAFYAYLSQDERFLTRHHTLVFDTVITNNNGGYNPFTGAFTAPVDGIYVFTYSIRMRCRSGLYGGFELVKNNDVEGVLFVSGGNACDQQEHSTGIAVIHANKGDSVVVRTHPTHEINGDVVSDSSGRTSFTGWLL